MTDARFEDGAEEPLRLLAQDADDVPVISTLVQDGVVQSSDLSWMKSHRRFAALITRFRWEDRDKAERMGRAYERVQSVLTIEDVSAVRTSGIDPRDKDLILSILSVAFEAGEDGAGRVLLTFAGDGALALDVDCVDMRLEDVTRPFAAQSGKAPDHGA